jgi:hypothetical protein
MTWATSPSPRLDDRYCLRELAWCGLCEVLLKPAWLSPGGRFYGCPNVYCPRPLMPAELLETLVWQAFLYLFADPAAEATAEEQRQVLTRVLERVTVGPDLGQVRYRWLDGAQRGAPGVRSRLPET